MSTEPLVTNKDISEALNISRNRYEYIVLYVTQMLKDYQGNVTDIVKEIPLNLKGKERHFAMHMIGRSSSSTFSRMSDEDKTTFIKDIMEALRISQEKAVPIIQDMANETSEEMKNIDTIKKIIDSNYTEIEKDYLLFMVGLI